MTGRWKFCLITSASVLALVCTLALGRWQLARAAEKESMQARIATQSALPPLEGLTLAVQVDPAAELHRNVRLRGRWLDQWTVFLENRPMQGRVGLYVVTPLQLDGSAAVVWVQRGWVARNFVDRSHLPPLETATGLVEIQGRITPPPAKLYELGPAQSGRLRQNLDLAQFRRESALPLLVVSVQQLGPSGDGLVRDWPAPGSGVERHYGYAFQWFGLSGLISLLYVWFQLVRRFIRPRRP